MSRRVFDTGDDINLTVKFSDPDSGDLVDPDTVEIRVKKPDKSTITPSVDHVSLGTFRATVRPASSEYGRWYYRGHGTGQVQATQERYFVVRRPEVV